MFSALVHFINMSTSIGERIKKAREARSLSQSELARLLRLRPQSVQQWESGNAGPQRKRLDAVAKVLDVSVSWLATGVGPMQSSKSGEQLLQELKLPHDIVELAKLLRELPAEKVKAALVLLGIHSDAPATKQTDTPPPARRLD